MVFGLAGSANKLAGAHNVAADFARWQYPRWFMTVTGMIEVITVVLQMVPRWTRRGAILSGLVMCGALLITHWGHGEGLRSTPALLLLGIPLFRVRLHSNNNSSRVVCSEP